MRQTFPAMKSYLRRVYFTPAHSLTGVSGLVISYRAG
jgi:hypothetical protein